MLAYVLYYHQTACRTLPGLADAGMISRQWAELAWHALWNEHSKCTLFYVLCNYIFQIDTVVSMGYTEHTCRSNISFWTDKANCVKFRVL